MQVESRARQAEGSLQDFYGQAKETMAAATGPIRENGDEAGDFVRTTIEEHPYTTAAIALGIGYLLGQDNKACYPRRRNLSRSRSRSASRRTAADFVSRWKGSYATYEAAETARRGIKKHYPTLQVAVYDVESVNKNIEVA
jgi:hypothetical protein